MLTGQFEVKRTWWRQIFENHIYSDYSLFTHWCQCACALPVGHLWSQTKRRVWSLSCWVLLLSTVLYRKYLFQA